MWRDASWLILPVAFVSLAAGVALYLWALRRPRARYVNGTNVVAWLLIGLFPTLIIFSFFPESSAEGEVVGISVGGAIAAFAAIFLLGSRAGAKALERDQNFDRLNAEIRQLRAEGVAPGATKRPIGEQLDLRYRIGGKGGRELVILTGELDDVRGVDVWVSSENTNMQMATYYDRSVSSTVRYLGASKDASGHPVDDVIANELAGCMAELGVRDVEPATVIATGAGMLADRDVKRVYHVAAVRGEHRVGYRPVGNVAGCVTNALAKLDSEGTPYQSIVFPLLGTGVAGGDPRAIVGQLFSAATQYVRQNPDTRVRKIYFLARHLEDLDVCVHAADSRQDLTRTGGSAKRLLEREPASATS